MQHIKMSNFSQVKNNQISISKIDLLVNQFHLDSFLKRATIAKKSGKSTDSLLFNMFLVCLSPTKSVSEGLKYLNEVHCKSAYYDFLNNPNYNWRKFLLSVAKYYSSEYSSDEKSDSYLIIDDTAKEKHGKKVEYISRYRDNSTNTYFRGYEVLFAGWCNGRTTIPIDFTIKIGDNPCKGSKRGKYPDGSRVNHRIKEARNKKSDLSLMIVKRAMKHRISFNYLLWDSWYNNKESYDYVYKTLIKKGIHLISVVRNGEDKYQYNKQELPPKEIYKHAGKWLIIESNKVLYKSVDINVLDKSNKKRKNRDTLGKAKLHFFHFPKQKKGEYKVILSTDTTLSAEDVLKKYAHRWSIEVMFKDLKQLFGFKQAQLSKYSSQVADLSIRCVLYIMLCSLKDREPRKTMYIILFEVSSDMENYYIQMLVLSLFKAKLREFNDFLFQSGFIEVKIPVDVFDEIVDHFLYLDGYIEKIVEI